MRIDRKKCAICLLCLLMLLLAACHSGSGGDDDPPAPEAGALPGFVTAHFPTFELSVPESWTVRGNVGKLYEGEGIFLLTGPLSSEDKAFPEGLESTVSEELQLFFNTEYYRSQTRFEYDTSTTTGSKTLVSGTLWNDRAGTSLRFTGAVEEASRGHYLYFWQDDAEEKTATRYGEVTDESFRVL